MKALKRIMAGVLAAASLVTCFSMYAGAYGASKNYSLYYTKGAPSEAIHVSEIVSVTKSSGTENIRINTTKFINRISGMYLYAKCTNYSANPYIINRTGICYLDYSQSIPLTGKSVSVQISAIDYTSSETFRAEGNVSA